MALVEEIEQALFAWAPKSLAAEWDNVGLLVGRRRQEVRRILVALDVTERVVDEAAERGAELIVAHHPVMNCRWHAVQRIVDDDGQGRVLRKLIQNDISAICMHTNLDACEGGVNDVLAGALGLTGISALSEEKIGRVGTLPHEMGLEEFLRHVVQSLHLEGLRYRSADRPVYKVAVGGGACGEYIANAIALGCDTFVTSDLKYHTFLDTEGLNLVDAGHFETENPVCEALCGFLRRSFGTLAVEQAVSHRSVIQYAARAVSDTGA